METINLCQSLNWDSEIFGRKIARVTQTRLNATEMQEILAWCAANAMACLYFAAEANDPNTVKLAEQNGFNLVDVRLTFERPLADAAALGDPIGKHGIRLSALTDIPFLKPIAKVSYRNARFYYDAHFPTAQCDALHEAWIENSCKGYAEAVLVADSQNRPSGYITCHLPDPLTGNIGLVGVSAEAQGKGLGRILVEAGFQWFAEQGVKTVTVVTQGRNVKAQRLYQKCGFLTSAVQLFYHRWFQ